MSYPFPSYVADDTASLSSNLKTSSLLTPPVSPLDEHERPFKPAESDQTSLNMKRRRHYHDEVTYEPIRIGTKKTLQSKQEDSKDKLGDECGTNESTRAKLSFATRSKSLSAITSQDSLPTSQCSGIDKSRRWTLPFKSAATQSVTPLRSTVKQSTAKNGNSNESPAMITLRRATTSRPPKRTELTFFPEPKFGNQKTGLFSYLVSTLTGDDKNGRTQGTPPWSARSRGSKPQSISVPAAHPPMTFPAPTVFTETTIESSLTIPGLVTQAPTLRRCSTKYVSGGSTYEVIWDENETSGSSRKISEQSADMSPRRASLAFVKLEEQLCRDFSRRLSDQSSSSLSGTSTHSERMFLDRVLTPEKLKEILPRLLHKASLRDLPRSKGTTQIARLFEHTVNGSIDNEYVSMNESQTVAGGIDFFPPLRSRSTSGTGANTEKLRRATALSITPPSPRQVRFGDMIGSSSHTRRRSSALPHRTRRKASAYTQYRAGTGSEGSMLGALPGYSDTQPLLRRQSEYYSSRS